MLPDVGTSLLQYLSGSHVGVTESCQGRVGLLSVLQLSITQGHARKREKSWELSLSPVCKPTLILFYMSFLPEAVSMS